MSSLLQRNKWLSIHSLFLIDFSSFVVVFVAAVVVAAVVVAAVVVAAVVVLVDVVDVFLVDVVAVAENWIEKLFCFFQNHFIFMSSQ